MFGKLTDGQREKYEQERIALLQKMASSDEKQKAILIGEMKRLSRKGLAEASINIAIYYGERVRSRETEKERALFQKKAKEYLLLYAKQGTAYDQFCVGTYFEFGEHNFPVDMELAAKCYRMGADGGSPNATMNLGRCYMQGRGVPLDYEKAMEYFERAVEKGCPRGWLNIGLMYMDAKGVKKDLYRAQDCFERAIRQVNDLKVNPNPETHYSASDLREIAEETGKYLEQIRVVIQCEEIRQGKTTTEESSQKLLEELFEKARAGNKRAQFELGLAYEDGAHGLPQDYGQALYWYQQCADVLGGALFNIGILYYNGRGVPQDYTQAAEYFKRSAAATNNRYAQDCLGTCYEKGRGVPQDYAQAAEWFRKAAEQGIEHAQMSLGFAYERGQGVPRDDQKAAYWYQKAVDNEDREADELDALYFLGVMYMEGRGVPRDYRRAKELLEMAAAGGRIDADNKLREVYRRLGKKL